MLKHERPSVPGTGARCESGCRFSSPLLLPCGGIIAVHSCMGTDRFHTDHAGNMFPESSLYHGAFVQKTWEVRALEFSFLLWAFSGWFFKLLSFNKLILILLEALCGVIKNVPSGGLSLTVHSWCDMGFSGKASVSLVSLSRRGSITTLVIFQ